MSKHRVKISHDWWEAVLEIDDSPETLELMEEQLLFWTGGQRRIDAVNGDIKQAYLRMLAQALIYESMEFNVEGVRCEFDDREGWFDLRGQGGVKLISCNQWKFEEDDFAIKTIRIMEPIESNPDRNTIDRVSVQTQKHWRIHTNNLLNEILNNPGVDSLRVPLHIFAQALMEVADRCSRINDSELNKLMCRLTLYEVADLESEHYDKSVIAEVFASENSVDNITEPERCCIDFYHSLHQSETECLSFEAKNVWEMGRELNKEFDN